ncbi:ABC transporter permease [Pseudofrankia inefficax]|uniref:Inner-membrane translocator n=1 Tax=Pseudofrankia inefficax (strain DSM 45817 / CECT 9037 / DDB 130130 / EuI1c) TaxID=298654 RepID=E3J943_PSEI1|nr:ABC transporter permease [Pseudofrankia inefficax]ADP80922.1 inner-membrane translocator [Pseudofrankia inefficax]
MATTASRKGNTAQLVLGSAERLGLPILFVALILIFAIHPDSRDAFLSKANIDNILAGQSVTGIVALGMVIPLTAGYFDVSIPAIAGVANMACTAAIVRHGQPVWVGMLVALLIGVLLGVVNGVLVARLKLNALIVTLGGFTVLQGLLNQYSDGATITGVPDSLGNWGSLKWLGIPRPLWLLFVVGLILWYCLMHTPFGRQYEAVGSSEGAARLVGIRVERLVFLSFVLSGLTAAVAGILLTSRSGGADPTAGPSYLFPGLAAVFLGATTIRPGTYNVWGTILGIFFVAVGINGFTLIGAKPWVNPVFDGAALIAAVLVSTVIGRRRTSHAIVVEPAQPDVSPMSIGRTSDSPTDRPADEPSEARPAKPAPTATRSQ